MRLSEIFNTKTDLIWSFDVNEYYSEFKIEDRMYGVSAIEEEIDDFRTVRIDFHIKTDTGISHDASNINSDAFKVLAIISNAVKSKFSEYDIIYFLAKKSNSDKEFGSRVKLYSRIVDKLKIENNRIAVKKEFDNEFLFALCKTNAAHTAILNFI